MILFLLISIPLFLLIIVAGYNLLTNPLFKSSKFDSINPPLVSVLIPARNEEDNISKCVKSILDQTYTNIEIIVLDDNSTDKTYEIASKLLPGVKNYKLLTGKPLPENFLGKNWACHQLAENANGQFLLFIDADVALHKDCIESSLKYFNSDKTDVLTIFPTQKIKSTGEWLVVPLMNWILLLLLPLNLVFKSRNKSFIAANGQFFMWRRFVYDKTGGHQSASTELVEDMFLASKAKQLNFRVMTLLGGDLVNCRMYKGLLESINGFSKNFYPGFRMPAFLFAVFILVIFLLNVLPFIFVFVNEMYFIPILMIICSRAFISILSKQNATVNIILHPLQMLFMFITGIYSMVIFHNKNIVWKGRKVLS
ncbi:MAG: glycosyltransferase family 2 protein [Ignavibacteriales bacterium]|nr:MAG: glycosyltransferase family 2 protein [Ignavibacteriales bacterium]